MNQRYCFNLLLCICLYCLNIAGGAAQSITNVTDRLYTPDMIAWRSNTTYLPVSMDNTHDVTAVQFNIGIPREMEVAAQDAFRLTSRATDHVVQARRTKTDDTMNWYLVMIYSPTNASIVGRTGKILEIKFTMSDNAEEGAKLTPAITNGVMSTPDKKNVCGGVSCGYVSIEYGPDLIAPSVTLSDQSVSPDGVLNLSWTVQNIGDQTVEVGWSEEISIVEKSTTTDNYTTRLTRYIGTVRYDSPLEGHASVSRNATLQLPALIGIDGECKVMIKIVPYPESNERPESRGNNIIVSDQILNVNKSLTLTLNQTSVIEKRTQRVIGTINRSGRWDKEETFNISVSGDGRVSAPATVTISKGQSAARFDVTIEDNDKLDPLGQITTIVVKDAATTNAYASVSCQLTVEDDELPELEVKSNKTVITEGESIKLTITAERAPSEDLTLHIGCDLAKRFDFPATVTLPKGKTTVTVDVTSKDDNTPAVSETPAFTVSADGYASGKAHIVLEDDDVPAISLTLSPTSVSESAGPVAMMCVLRRTSNVDSEITVRLSDNSPLHDINFGQFSSIKMDKGVEEVEFSIGVNDNLTVEGDRDVTITAAVYIQSCGCSPVGENAGVVRKEIHIIDNDGPSLTLTSSRSMMLEGAEEATILTVTRNTTVSVPLTITITSSYDDGFEYSHEVVIPQGQRSVKVPIKSLSNFSENDNKTITFTAKAANHSDGICWAMLSDQSMADATVSVELLSADGNALPDKGIMVNTSAQARVKVSNIGVIPLPAGTVVDLYQGSSKMTTFKTLYPIEAGADTTFTYTLYSSSSVGTLSAYAKVNEERTIRELLYGNNTSATASIKVYASYITTLSVDKKIIEFGDSVKITGKIMNPDGSAWKSDNTTVVEMYMLNAGQRLKATAIADKNGNFSSSWTPGDADMGHYGFGACYPGENKRDELTSVDIYGLQHVSGGEKSFYTVLEQPYSGSFSVSNPSGLPLTNFKVEVVDNPFGSTFVINAPKTINAGETATIHYTLTGHQVQTLDEWQTISLKMTTEQGAQLQKTLYYYTRNPKAQLASSISQINTTMTKGHTRDYSFYISNIGLGNTGTVTVSLPSWMQSVTPLKLAPMEKGDTTQVIVRFAPTEDMQLNVPVTGQIAVNCDNSNGIAIPFNIMPVSENTGTLILDVCDEYTYYTEEAPHLSGAKVSVLNPSTGAVIAQDITDVNGLFAITLPEGYYKLNVTHPNHESYTATILLDPGKETRKVINLSFQAIEVTWKVEETTVEDKYEITTTVKYETRVPMPVVVTSIPESIPAKELAEGESLIFYATLTNEGLITAKNVSLEMPEGFNVLKFEPLRYIDEKFELAPQQSVVIPVKVTNTSSATGESRQRRVKPIDNEPCFGNLFTDYEWECGTDHKYHRYPKGLHTGECKKIEFNDNFSPNTSPSDPDFFWPFKTKSSSGGGTPNSPGTPSDTKIIPGESSQDKVGESEPYECQPCKNKFLKALLEFIPYVSEIKEVAKTLKDVIDCAGSFAGGSNLHDKMSGCAFTSAIPKAYDEINQALDNIAYDIAEVNLIVGRIKGHVMSDGIFSEQVANDCRGIADAAFDAIANGKALASIVSDVSNKVEGMVESVNNQIDQAIAERDEYIAGRDRVFFNTEQGRKDAYNDRVASGEVAAKQEEDIRKKKEEFYQQAEQNIATKDDYKNALQTVGSSIANGKIDQKGLNKLVNSGIKVGADLLYNAHDFKEMAKTQGAMEQAALKNAYLQGTDKLCKIAPKITNFLAAVYGECEYEGAAKRRYAGSNQSDAGQATNAYDKIPRSYKELVTAMESTADIIDKYDRMNDCYFGSEVMRSLSPVEMAPIWWAVDKVKQYGEEAIDNPMIGVYCPEGISVDTLKTFLRRWYNTYINPSDDENVMDVNQMEELSQSIRSDIMGMISGQGCDIDEFLDKKVELAYDDMSSKSTNVCASITLQFKQTMTLTRQAFRGTLGVVNGNANEAMQDIVLELEVRNATDGSIATSREMQISAESLNGFEGNLNLTDGWSLAPSGEGTATILFIPSKYAAPTEDQDYTFGGRLRYLDPFSHTVVTRELSPVTLTVKPSPELDLTYFMQRDIIGDDALTEAIEPSKEAEFSLLIHNKGYGNATNVNITTEQPKIIDNQKGLFIDFELMSSQLNGMEKNLALGGSVNTAFGDIPAGSSSYAQWWFKSSLLGHFVEYDVEATHVTSYGNPDLSLLDQVTIHELIRSIDNGGETAFLTNDIEDANDTPDMLYLMDGSVVEVANTDDINVKRISNTTYEINITPSAQGWNYGNVVDPTYGVSELRGIVRKSDGKEISLRNIWQTDRTLRDGDDPLYENRIHIVDEFAGVQPETYILTFDPAPTVWLKVASVTGMPQDGTLCLEPISYIDVTFNKSIDPESFSVDDIVLSVQGEKQDISALRISTEDNRTFRLDFTNVNESLPNGYYNLSIQTADITDYEEFQGKDGKHASWVMFREGQIMFSKEVYPLLSGSVSYVISDNEKKSEQTEAKRRNAATDGTEGIGYGSTVKFIATPEEGYQFVNWTLNGVVMSTEPEFEYTALNDINLVANFAKKKFKVTIEDSKNGYVSAAQGYYEYGDELTITAEPSRLYAVDYWTVNGENVGDESQISLVIDKPYTVSVQFFRDLYDQNMTLSKGWNWVSSYLTEPIPVNRFNRSVNRIVGQFDEAIEDPEFGMAGGLNAVKMYDGYKIEANYATQMSFSGHILAEQQATVSLNRGWNWIGYPWDAANALSSAIANAEEGDFVISQTGFAEYDDGYWEGSLQEFVPGKGYMYRSESSKNIILEPSESVTVPIVRKAKSAKMMSGSAVDIHSYPNTMNVTARLSEAGVPLDAEEFVIYAMAGSECRGVSQSVGNNHYLTVYGDSPIDISFIIENVFTGESYIANETLRFCSDVVGSRKNPYMITIGGTTLVSGLASDSNISIYSVEGVLLRSNAGRKDIESLKKGVYIINGQKYYIR